MLPPLLAPVVPRPPVQMFSSALQSLSLLLPSFSKSVFRSCLLGVLVGQGHGLDPTYFIESAYPTTCLGIRTSLMYLLHKVIGFRVELWIGAFKAYEDDLSHTLAQTHFSLLVEFRIPESDSQV